MPVLATWQDLYRDRRGLRENFALRKVAIARPGTLAITKRSWRNQHVRRAYRCASMALPDQLPGSVLDQPAPLHRFAALALSSAFHVFSRSRIE
jgi:hypothetical protein